MESYILKFQFGNSGYYRYYVNFHSLGVALTEELDTTILRNLFAQEYHSEELANIDVHKMFFYETYDDDEIEDDDSTIYVEEDDENYKYVVISSLINKGDIPFPILNKMIYDPYAYFRCEWYEETDEDEEIKKNGIFLYDNIEIYEIFVNNHLFDPELDGESGQDYIDYLNYMSIKKSKKTCFAHLVEYSWMTGVENSIHLTFKVAIPKSK